MYIQVKSLKIDMYNLMNKYKTLKIEQIEEMVKDFSPKQKEAVRTIFKASSVKSQKGMRYSNDWVYECILMKIKGPALYKKIRRDNILPLPSLSTLQRYIHQLQPSYGFQESVFQMIEEKAKFIPNFEKHGIHIFYNYEMYCLNNYFIKIITLVRMFVIG